jgi:hypothetical protein
METDESTTSRQQSYMATIFGGGDLVMPVMVLPWKCGARS